MKLHHPILLSMAIAWTVIAAVSPLVDGKFGLALDARKSTLTLEGREAYAKPPLTVECWAKLNQKDSWNILIANEGKESGTHWEIYSCMGNGYLSVYLPGYSPNDIRSGRDITDGQWHYLAMVLDGESVRLYVDAEEVANRLLTRDEEAKESRPGSLTIGFVPPSGSNLDCNGLIDEIRISKVARTIAVIPNAPFTHDAGTVALWHMDEMPKEAQLTGVSRVSFSEMSQDIESFRMLTMQIKRPSEVVFTNESDFLLH